MNDFVGCCRLCLVTLSNIDLFVNTQEELNDILENVSKMFGFDIAESTLCSKNVCTKCSNKVRKILLFKSEVLANQIKIQQFISLQEELAEYKKEVVALRDDDDVQVIELPSTRDCLLASDQDTIGSFELLASIDIPIEPSEEVNDKKEPNRVVETRAQKRKTTGEGKEINDCKKQKNEEILPPNEEDPMLNVRVTRSRSSLTGQNKKPPNPEDASKKVKTPVRISQRRKTLAAHTYTELEIDDNELDVDKPKTPNKSEAVSKSTDIPHNAPTPEKASSKPIESLKNTHALSAVNEDKPQNTLSKPAEVQENTTTTTAPVVQNRAAIIAKKFSDDFEQLVAKEAEDRKLIVAKVNTPKTMQQKHAAPKNMQPEFVSANNRTSISVQHNYVASNNKAHKVMQKQYKIPVEILQSSVEQGLTKNSGLSASAQTIRNIEPKPNEPQSPIRNFRMVKSNYGSVQIPVGSSISSSPAIQTEQAPTTNQFQYINCNNIQQQRTNRPVYPLYTKNSPLLSKVVARSSPNHQIRVTQPNNFNIQRSSVGVVNITSPYASNPVTQSSSPVAPKITVRSSESINRGINALGHLVQPTSIINPIKVTQVTTSNSNNPRYITVQNTPKVVTQNIREIYSNEAKTLKSTSTSSTASPSNVKTTTMSIIKMKSPMQMMGTSARIHSQPTTAVSNARLHSQTSTSSSTAVSNARIHSQPPTAVSKARIHTQQSTSSSTAVSNIRIQSQASTSSSTAVSNARMHIQPSTSSSTAVSNANFYPNVRNIPAQVRPIVTPKVQPQWRSNPPHLAIATTTPQTQPQSSRQQIGNIHSTTISITPKVNSNVFGPNYSPNTSINANTIHIKKVMPSKVVPVLIPKPTIEIGSWPRDKSLGGLLTKSLTPHK